MRPGALAGVSLVALTVAWGCTPKSSEEANTCTDGVQNANETGVDCGGNCSACSATPTCTDGVQNGTETGVDCGGSCSACSATPTCTDGIQNGTETGVDCGGSCNACAPTPSCTDGVRNGDETGVDCGGSCGACTGGCQNGTQDGDETGVDCGGSCGNQDCCSNGYADLAGGETGLDCGGACGACAAATYFVANSGNDNSAGTSPSSAWQTIDKVNGATLNPGDAVLFQRGDTWREALTITRSGAANAYIAFGAYGQGARPRILGSQRATSWSAVPGSTNIWQSGTTLDRPNVGKASSIFFGHADGSTTWGRVQATDQTPACGNGYANLQQEYDWCWQDGIFVYAPADPGSRYAFVEVPQRRSAIAMPGHSPAEYITIDGLELMYTTMYGYDDGWPMDYEVHGLNIQNCHIGYVGIQGGSSAMGLQIWHSDMVVRNNEIHDCGRRSISYNVYLDNGRSANNLVFENVLMEGNVLYHGFHTTGFDISCEAGSGGSTFGDTFRNFTLRNNVIWDDPNDDPQASPNDFTSMGMYLWGEAALFSNFNVYNNVFMNIKQKLLILHGVTQTRVFNNTFYGMNARAGVLGGGSAYRGMVNINGAVSDLSFDNNIVYGNVDSAQYHLQCVTFSGGAESGMTSMNRNLYFQDDQTQPLITTTARSYTAGQWSAYQTSGLGFDQDSPPPGNPRFTNAQTADFSLQMGSPAIDQGAVMSGRTSDRLGNPMVGAPDIGANEYQP